jgi:hypothetical protein
LKLAAASNKQGTARFSFCDCTHARATVASAVAPKSVPWDCFYSLIALVEWSIGFTTTLFSLFDVVSVEF